MMVRKLPVSLLKNEKNKLNLKGLPVKAALFFAAIFILLYFYYLHNLILKL